MEVRELMVEEHTSYDEVDELLPWYVSWTGAWVGALSALALLLVFGLTAIAVGAHQVGQRVTDWHDFSLLALAFSVFGAFLSFAVGGWVAARVAGLRRAEPAMLHGALVWLLAIPALLLLATLGAGGYLGTWYGGLAGAPPWSPQATPLESPAAAMAARNAALGALAALLLGLVGGTIGGWMGSGERMTLTYWKRPYGPRGRAWGETQ